MNDPFLQAAYDEAFHGMNNEGGIPIGSVLVHDGEIIGRGHNLRIQRSSPVFHGEMAALEDAQRRSPEVYRQCTLYTTLSPCVMCTGAILLYRIPKVVIGENRTFLGREDLLQAAGVETLLAHEEDGKLCYDLLQSFITKSPEIWNEDIGEL